ncbi:MAG: rhomboid family intramembrane serine protease [Lachnospiraceae bacterium]|nr:rhomboid family intramembrane serine protease [Lachnospiraceae bacterium]
MSRRKSRLSNNSPVILMFTLICAAALVLHYITGGLSTRLVFSVYRSSPANPLTYVRLLGHVFGHGSFDHFMGNIMLILILGPMLEEKYGSSNMIAVIVITALVTGLVSILLFPKVMLLGASGVVFAMILMASFTEFRRGTVPITFILVALLYLGQQIYQGIFVQDNVSNLTHIVGGLIGALIGYSMNRKGR